MTSRSPKKIVRRSLRQSSGQRPTSRSLSKKCSPISVARWKIGIEWVARLYQMGRQVTFADRAKADPRAIPQGTAIQILHTLARFLSSQDGDVKTLQDIKPPLYRLRAQDHRVMFRDFGTHIEVTRIQNRRDAYR